MLSNPTRKEPSPLAIARLLVAEVGAMNSNRDTNESNAATNARVNARANAAIIIGINRSAASGATPKLCANWLNSSMCLGNTVKSSSARSKRSSRGGRVRQMIIHDDAPENTPDSASVHSHRGSQSELENLGAGTDRELCDLCDPV